MTSIDSFCVVRNHILRSLTGLGNLKGGVFLHNEMVDSKFEAHAVRKCNLWHERLGHPSKQVLSLHAKNLVFNLGNKTNEPCNVCFHAKQIHCSFCKSESKASNIFELIHCDILRAYCIPSTCGAHYFLSIVDDASRVVWGLFNA